MLLFGSGPEGSGKSITFASLCKFNTAKVDPVHCLLSNFPVCVDLKFPRH